MKQGLSGRRRMLTACLLASLTVSAVVLVWVTNDSQQQTLTESLPTVPWEGGPDYYAQFPTAAAQGWADPSFFPLAVWYQSVQGMADVSADKAVGFNTYVKLTEDSDFELIEAEGMSIIADPETAQDNDAIGALLADEADMWAGAGFGTWTGYFPEEGTPCTGDPLSCGFSVMDRRLEQVPGGLPTYANYGKGVVFTLSDQQASTFVNQWTTLAVSSDVYWYTDPYVCDATNEGVSVGAVGDRCRRAANYGMTIDRMRALDNLDLQRQPVWGFVEVGHPFEDPAAPTITGAQIEAAVMNSLIHGARGIVYFNHSFGGSCLSFAVVRDDCGAGVTGNVASVNQKITELAPVLNSPSLEWSFNPALDTMLKEGPDGSAYIFSMLGIDAEPGEHALELPAEITASRAEVMHEDRSVPIVHGKIVDVLSSETDYHVYTISPG